MIFIDVLAKKWSWWSGASQIVYCGSAPAKIQCLGSLLADPNDDVKATLARVRSNKKPLTNSSRIGGY
jgi:hypothetical protein